MVLIDLFSGVGGMAGGLIDAGFEFTHHYFSEIDKHAIAVYRYKFPHAEYIGSVKDVSGRTIRKRHPKDKILVTFGWPCQDNSIAGKRKGQRIGSRSGLLFEAGRIVLESKCESFLAENVKGLSSVNEGNDFYEAIRFLTYFNTDHPQYVLECQLLNTAWILPQNRERFYFVGHLGKRCERRIFPLTENDFGINEGAGETQSVGTLTGGGQFGRDAQFNDAITHINMIDYINPKDSQDKRIIRTTGDSNSLGVSRSMIPKILLDEENKPDNKRGGGRSSMSDKHSWDLVTVHTLQPRTGDPTKGGTGPLQRTDGTTYALDTGNGQAIEINAAAKYQQDIINDAEGTSKPLVAGTHGNAAHHTKTLIENRIRRLTETECERLQGFEDNWTQYGNYDGEMKLVSKTQRYKQMGNAVTKKIVQIIGSKLLSTFQQS